MADSTTPANGDGDVKRRFREALERKQAAAKARSSRDNLDRKAGQAHGPASHKRNFRRKSG